MRVRRILAGQGQSSGLSAIAEHIDVIYIQRTSSFMNFIVIICLAENELYLRQQVFYRALSIQICRI